MRQLMQLPTADGVEAREGTAADLLSALVARLSDKDRIVALGMPHRYVGRHTSRGNVTEYGKYGNPFSHQDGTAAQFKVATRREAVDSYANWIRHEDQRELLESARRELAGKVLLCHCQDWHASTPACHAEVLVRIANPALAAEEERELGRSGGAPCNLRLATAWEFEAWLTTFGLSDLPRVLFTGDRNWRSRRVVEHVVDGLVAHHGKFLAIQGEAPGADEMVRDICLLRGIPVAGFPARWEVRADTPEWAIRTGKNGPYDVRAGGLRNTVMSECAPTACFAFHDMISASKGTKDMCRTAWLKSIPVVVWSSDSTYEEFGAGQPGAELPWQLQPARSPAVDPKPAAIVESQVAADVPPALVEDFFRWLAQHPEALQAGA